MRVKCLAQEHNKMSPARGRIRSARSGVERANHEATAPPTGETSARIILSELVTRSDNVSSDSVKTVNRKLKKFCNQNNWKLVQHQNITINDLNQSGLHLNNRGNNILFNNL